MTLFQAWNEPNLARYLEPQWVVSDGRWSAFSPQIYRRLLDGFYSGIKSVEPEDDGGRRRRRPERGTRRQGRMAPVTFLRSLLCLSAGDAPRRESCPERARFDVLAFHPLSVGDPDLAAGAALDVSIADAAKVVDLLRAAEQLHTALPAGAKPLWVTELNWDSSPQSPPACPRPCRRGGYRARCTACGPPA